MIDSGCFRHVCPPWFAPQFPMVSSTTVDAVAANNVALQHYGQKVVSFGISRLSFLLARHFDEWNSSLQIVGDGWRKCDKRSG